MPCSGTAHEAASCCNSSRGGDAIWIRSDRQFGTFGSIFVPASHSPASMPGSTPVSVSGRISPPVLSSNVCF